MRFVGPPIGYSVGYSDGYSYLFVANSSWKLSLAGAPLLTGLFITAGFLDPNGSSVCMLYIDSEGGGCCLGAGSFLGGSPCLLRLTLLLELGYGSSGGYGV